jgi:hypothetical protein
LVPHTPLEHTLPVAHMFPHEPQFWLSVSVVAQYVPPSSTQSVCPRPHDETQLPATHCEPGPQAAPHLPQLLGSIEVSTH